HRKSQAMNGLLAEARDLVRRDGVDSDFMDASLMVAAQKVEAHEVACYACLHVQARFLGFHSDLAPLEKSFEDEKRMEENLRHFAMFYFDGETWFDPGQRGQNMIQHLLCRRPKFSATRAHLYPAGFVAVIALNPSLRADENGVAVIGEVHVTFSYSGKRARM